MKLLSLSLQDVDECLDSSQNNCSTNANCTDTFGNYACTCLPGYTGDGVLCSGKYTKSQFQLYNGCTKILTKAFFSPDVDECADGNDSCHSNASCSNVIGSYNCDCFPGFSGDGFSCSSKDILSTVQLRTLGTSLLLDVDECDDLNENNCSLYANCTDTIGSYDCTCSTGYTGDGYFCDGTY